MTETQAPFTAPRNGACVLSFPILNSVTNTG